MNTVANRRADADVGSVFLYTNEAHPGEYYPHLTSMQQKRQHGQALRDVVGVTRPILLDSLDGGCHRAYGSMPNMSWIFNQGGVPVYKADWTDPVSVANTLDYLLARYAQGQAGVRLVPFHVERLDYRTGDRVAFDQGLARNGPKAVREFRAAFG
jgi:hypothetical protein